MSSRVSESHRMTAADPRPAPKPAPRSRRGLYLPYVALLVVCLGWSAFWMVAAQSTESALADWFAQEEHVGRVWSCPQRSVGGFPFRIEVRCSRPGFAGRLGGMTGAGSVGDLLAAANLYNPTLIVAEVASPLAFRAQGDSLKLSLEWKDLRVSHRSHDGAFERGSLEIEAPVLRVEGTGFAALGGQARHAEVHVRPDPDSETGLEVALRAEGVVAAGLDALTGETSPLDTILSASVAQASAASGSSLPAILEHWRLAEGRIDLREFKAAKGDARLEARGQLALDPLHRLRGALDLSAAGMGPLLQRLGLPAGGLAMGGLLGGLLGATPAAGEAQAAPGTLRVPRSFANGRATIGPLRLPVVLQPVY